MAAKKVVKRIPEDQMHIYYDASGRLKKGHPGLPGAGKNRKRKLNIRRTVKERFGEIPDFLDYKAASLNLMGAGLIMDEDDRDLPRDFLTVEDLWVYVWEKRSMAGSREHTVELMDRADPKPQKIILDANINARAAVAGVSLDAAGARDWYNSLDPRNEDAGSAGGGDDDDDDDE